MAVNTADIVMPWVCRASVSAARSDIRFGWERQERHLNTTQLLLSAMQSGDNAVHLYR